MKKTLAIFAVLAAAISSLAADPSISGVSITQLSNRLVQVSYTLSDARAIVTPVFKLDGTPLDMASVVSLAGDVRRIVAPGDRRFIWNPKNDWTGAEIDTARLTVELTAWRPDSPPPKVVIDLDPMTESNTSNILYYVSETELPGGVGDKRYRTTKLLMSLVPAKNVRWRMGDGSSAKSKYVTLTKDFYMGAFPFTIGQGETALGTRGGENTDKVDALLLPMTASGQHIRNAQGANPPASGSYLDKLRSQTGVALDLPSEFQWEYAARGGIETMTDALALSYGWWGKSSSAGTWGACGSSRGLCNRDYPHPVGLKTKNPFGIYDILGDCTECTRTAWVDPVDTTEETDPEGPAGPLNTYTMRSSKHGSSSSASAQQFYTRASQWYTAENDNRGFRLILPVEPEAN